MFEGYSGYKMAVCPRCNKETFHLRKELRNFIIYHCRECLLGGVYDVDGGTANFPQRPARPTALSDK
jgi:late competence protein required for DNA uptake (superfamily II DNA/RNA helicase)